MTNGQVIGIIGGFLALGAMIGWLSSPDPEPEAAQGQPARYAPLAPEEPRSRQTPTEPPAPPEAVPDRTAGQAARVAVDSLLATGTGEEGQ